MNNEILSREASKIRNVSLARDRCVKKLLTNINRWEFLTHVFYQNYLKLVHVKVSL